MGSRGDAQPYCALGLGLQAAGYGCTIFTNPEHEPLVRACGLGMVSNGHDFKTWFCTDEKVQEANADRDIQKFLASFGESCAGTRLQMAERLLQEVTEKRYVSGVCTSLTKGARLDARDSRHRRRSIASKPQR